MKMCGCGGVPVNAGQTAAALEVQRLRAEQDAAAQAANNLSSSSTAISNANGR